MNRNQIHSILHTFVILMVIAACVPTRQAVQPQTPSIETPGIDHSAIATAVVGTRQAAAQQTAAARPDGLIVTGTALEKAGDGAMKYSDFDAGFEIIFPAGWLALRPDEEEFNTALTKTGAANKMLHAQMTADQAGYNPDYDRLYAYALRPDLEKNALLGFSKLVWDSQDSGPVDSEVMGNLVRDLESLGGIPGFRADTAQVHEDTPVKMIEIGGRFTVKDGQGGTIPYYATIVVFKPSASSAARITFSFADTYHAKISADVKSIIESIRIVGSQ